MASEKKEPATDPEPVDTPSNVEIDTLLGTARAAVTEITSLQLAAATAATDVGLQRTKATEHLSEIDGKREALIAIETAIKTLADKSAASSADIDDGAKFVITSKDAIAAALNESKEQAAQLKQSAAKASERLTSIATLLDEITQKREAAEALIAQLVEDRSKANELISVAATAQTEASAARDAIHASAELSAQECRNVHDGKLFVDEQRIIAEQFANSTKTKLDEATATTAEIQALLSKAEEENTKAANTLTEIVAAASQADDAKTAAQEDQKITAALAKLASSTSERVQAYEANLKSMSSRFDELNNKIESLLPGATSAGLAASFHAQKDKYVRPKSLWNAVFIIAITGLAAIGVAEFAHHLAGNTLTYDELLRSLLTRITLVVALVWLALHASGKSRIANQIQEDYTYKEAVSRSFEGYKKEFASLPDHVTATSPLGTLCQSMVSILASSPSRVYDNHAQDPTPMSTLNETVKQLTELMKESKFKPGVQVKATLSDGGDGKKESGSA